MSSSKTLTLIILSLLALSSIYFIIVLQFQNGTMLILDSLTSETPQVLPPGPADSLIPLRQVYTKVWPLDMQVNRMTPFFWPLVSGILPELSLFGVYMAGQLVASETLIIVEGERRGNNGRVISYSTVWGLTWQNLPWGLVQPVYSFVHLLTASSSTPTITSVTGYTNAISSIPLAITTGYILPSVLMCIPSPQYISHQTHQALVFTWQLFPLWIGLAHAFFIKVSSTNAKNDPIKSLRNTYIFALLIACLSHLSIAGAVLALLYAPAPVQSYLQDILPPSFLPSNPALVFTPFPPHIPPFSKEQVSELSVGVLSLLQYDTIFAGFSSLLWASHLLHSCRRHHNVQSPTLGAVLLTLLFGPCGAALATMWKRDEEVFATAVRVPGKTVGNSKKDI
ncbi:hypothetical protein CVT25_004961 [Psilocybe cyanescens]|uniref:Uncharacterized protein n=1 Tax=Psilocybe cyanescens TaxID=93625 RepID=A0A409XUE7_PSICY|nr:hypothetical protein CVT25_004961 [Psilocybe cyanescens]